MKKVAGIIACGVLSSTLMAADGAAIYQKCAKCHGPKGNRTAMVPSSSGFAGWEKGKIIEYLKGYRAGKQNIYGKGHVMHDQVKSLSDREIEAVADYIARHLRSR